MALTYFPAILFEMRENTIMCEQDDDIKMYYWHVFIMTHV